MNLKNSMVPAFGLVLMAGLLGGSANAQTKLTSAKTIASAPKATTTTSAPANTSTAGTKVVAELPLKYHDMTEWRKSAAAPKRKAALSKATPAPVTKQIVFPDDHTVLKITMDKNSNGIVGVAKNPVGKSKKTTKDQYDCTTTTINLTANSSSFLNNDYSGTMANIFPGACYTYANLTDGHWQQQSGNRYAMQLSTNNTDISGNSYVNVNNPDQAMLQNGVTKLFQRMPNITGNESFSYQVSLADNSAAYSLEIGAGASGYGVTLSNVYSTANQSNHVHLTVDATKTLFSITTTPPDSGFFKDPTIENTPYLSFISAVNYGVRVLANADLQFNSEQEADQFKASYSGFGFSANLNVGYGSVSSSVQATINCYVVGGPGGQTVAYSLKDLEKQIQNIFAHCTYKDARPIKYEVSTFSGEQLNTYTATDNFTEVSCVPANGGSPEIDNIVLTVSQGSDGKEPKTGFRIDVDAGMTTGASNDPMFTVYTCGTENEGFANNSVTTIILKPAPGYKGKLDEETLQKAGGHIHIWPICYTPYATSGIGYDLWDITGVTMTINLKPTADNPAATSIGGNTGNLKWAFNQGPLVMSSQSQNQVDLYFNASLSASGANN
jgi:hypothetical protein